MPACLLALTWGMQKDRWKDLVTSRRMRSLDMEPIPEPNGWRLLVDVCVVRCHKMCQALADILSS